MPLKHATETRLVLFLGGIFVCIGFSVRLFPPLPDGAFLFGGLWVLSFFYPLLLLPLFRARRAEYAFRALHFLPSLLLLVWVALHLLRLSGFPVGAVFAWYTWEEGLLPLLGSFFLLFLYCFHVIRQRVSRSIALFGLLLLLVLPLLSSLRGSFASFRTMVVFSPDVSLNEEAPFVNTDPSSSLAEEVWRMRLRRMHRRRKRLNNEDGLVDRPVVSLEGVPTRMNASSSSTLPKLVSSGIGFEWSVVVLLALYTGILHARARRRV